jgi:hypothetical protein
MENHNILLIICKMIEVTMLSTVLSEDSGAFEFLLEDYELSRPKY